MYKVWIGNRESEIITYNIFDESITYYGSNKMKNHSFSNDIRTVNSYNFEFKEFVVREIRKIIHIHSDAEFHFYNPMFAHKILKTNEDLRCYFFNINSYETLKWITSKTFVRNWLSNTTLTPSYALLSKYECEMENLESMFPTFHNFIIQKDISGGGEGTYLLTNSSKNEVFAELNEGALYLVSPYYSPKISACCHMLIGNDDIAVFPFGIQASEIYNNKILYKGTSYKENNIIEKKHEQKLFENAVMIGRRLQQIGYRGICGLDFIIYNDMVIFIEINARYLGSTFLVNKALQEQNLPSVFQLNSKCFNDKIGIFCNKIRTLKIECYSNTVKSKMSIDEFDIKKLIENKSSKATFIYYDGLENAKQTVNNAYLYREIYC